jgi:prolyl 4-hydroxylase
MELAVLLALCVIIVWFWWRWLPERRARGFTDKNAEWEEPKMVSAVITPEECKYLIDKAEPSFSRSTVVASTSIDSTRTSETAWIPREDPVVRKILEKAIELTGKPFENCEDMQIVRYKPGAYYRAHHDSCCVDNNSCLEFERQGGQRVGTLLVYLNNDFTEGHTHFPNFNNLKLKAEPGSAIFFRPLGTKDPRCHPSALHSGLPIATGTKYVCNIWVRETKFR